MEPIKTVFPTINLVKSNNNLNQTSLFLTSIQVLTINHTQMRIYNRANSRSLYSPDSRASPPASGVERNFVTRRSWTPSSLGSSGSGGDTRMDGHQSPTQSPPRLNSIAELLEHFRKEDPSHGDDMKAVGNLPIYNSSPRGSSSSSSLSPGSESEVSSVSMDSAKDIKDEVSGLGPVDHWLSELPSLCESECSVMLQSKSLQGRPRPAA